MHTSRRGPQPGQAGSIQESFGRQRAQGMVEYGLILAFVSFVAIVGLIWMGPAISSMMAPVTTSI